MMNFQEETLIDLFSHLPVSVAWIDPHRIYRFVTPSYAQLFREARPNDLLGRSFYDFFPEMKATFERIFDRSAAIKEAIEVKDLQPFFPEEGERGYFRTAKVW